MLTVALRQRRRNFEPVAVDIRRFSALQTRSKPIEVWPYRFSTPSRLALAVAPVQCFVQGSGDHLGRVILHEANDLQDSLQCISAHVLVFRRPRCEYFVEWAVEFFLDPSYGAMLSPCLTIIHRCFGRRGSALRRFWLKVFGWSRVVRLSWCTRGSAIQIPILLA